MIKIAVFGTGSFYDGYKYALKDCNIIAIVDNSHDVIGSVVDGFEVQDPKIFDFKLVDNVVILIKDYENVVEQLYGLGVEGDRIIRYYELNKIYKNMGYLHSGNGVMHQKEWINKTNGRKRILVLSHDFSRTGVPVVGMHTSRLLNKMKYSVLYGALRSGLLKYDIEKNNIDYIEYFELMDEDERNKLLAQFDAFVLCTIAVANIVPVICSANKPIMWWINESYQRVFDSYRLVLNDNIFYYGDGDAVIKNFKSFYPNVDIKPLYYYLPDDDIEGEYPSINESIRFITIGAISKRKALDVLIDAIDKLPENIETFIEFIIIGKEANLNVDWIQLKKKHPNITKIDEVSQRELAEIIKTANVLICPSREDSEPVVVTQAFQNEIPCIVSTGVGQAKFMNNDYGGYVFRNEDSQDLADKIMKAVSEKESLKHKGKEGRQIFDNYFSEQAHREVVEKWLTSVLDYEN